MGDKKPIIFGLGVILLVAGVAVLWGTGAAFCTAGALLILDARPWSG